MATGSPAFAEANSFEERAKELAKVVAKKTLANARRSIAFGPFMGAASGNVMEGTSDYQLSAGIALYTFDVPVLPTAEDLAGVLLSRAKNALKERIDAAGADGTKPNDEDVERLARETWEEIKNEFMKDVRPKIFEKPVLALRGEVGYALDTEAWDIRTTLAIGIGPVYVTPGLALLVGHSAVVFLPMELSVPMVFGDSVRTPVVDIFLRFELAAHGRDENADRASLGARFLFDIL